MVSEFMVSARMALGSSIAAAAIVSASHDCLNKRLSRGEESGSDDEYEFDDENRNSHFGFSAEHEDDPFDTTKR